MKFLTKVIYLASVDCVITYFLRSLFIIGDVSGPKIDPAINITVT